MSNKFDKYILNKKDNSIVLKLFGDIGYEKNGHDFSDAIDYYSELYPKVTILINSGGGSVIQGYSIFNSILTSKAKVYGVVVGLAGSMAAVITQAFHPDRISAYDYANIMIHNASMLWRSSDPDEYEREENTLKAVNASLTMILSRKGFDSENIKSLMEKETWLTAQESLDMGLISKVKSTKIKEFVENALKGVDKIAANYMPFIKNKITKTLNMKSINAAFGLPENTTEAEMIAKVKADIEALRKTNAEMEAEIKLLREKQKEETEKQAKEAVAKDIAAGLIKADQRESMEKLAIENLAMYQAVISALETPNASLYEAVKAVEKEAPKQETKDYQYYMQNNAEWMNLLKINPAQAEKLEKEYEQKIKK